MTNVQTVNPAPATAKSPRTAKPANPAALFDRAVTVYEANMREKTGQRVFIACIIPTPGGRPLITRLVDEPQMAAFLHRHGSPEIAAAFDLARTAADALDQKWNKQPLRAASDAEPQSGARTGASLLEAAGLKLEA